MDMIWFIIIAVMVLSFVIQQVLNSKFNKYSKVGLHSGLTGAQVAAKMLEDHGITDVSITCIKGKLTDHYNPVNKTVNLSEEVYYGNSVAAAAVAAHECGHVVQHATGYAPLKLRSALVPVVSFSSNAVQWVLLIGVMIIKITPTLLYLGIAMFALTTLFSVVTLPVEINASARAVQWLDKAGITGPATKAKAVDALKWAAYTYVIAAIGSIATLIYYIAMARRR
ncbi:MAG: zinc metallopeptidase [Bacteroidales bacterium]|nr:zinc metallopeptidase [Bacteroidales bacterium]MEE3463451.1 zinc metallopeptidase [Candidatus Cryptobacteroides sp.]MBQ2525850.1 zinc metallopeptidase [Bacteroidales bacterium]MBQ3916864.1 zinc metallopeptidase [Bacteroidales bacterium]MBQ3997684.1 zinc metallopeptidase [Bacteroidales bacterium]